MSEDRKNTKKDEVDLRGIFMIFIRRKWWFIGSVLIVLIAGLLYTFMQPSSYLLTYQIKVNKNYYNGYLSELYPHYEEELNYISLVDIPVLFKSEYVFKSLGSMDEDIDYNKLLKPESEIVKVSLNKNKSIVNISASNPDYNMANKILKTLIDTFDSLIRDSERIIFNEVLGKIEVDIKNLEDENNNYEDTIIAGLKDELYSLYIKLNRYIVDYNVNLYDELEKNKKSENVYFYNVKIPPNAISYEMSEIKEEINSYREKILENESKIISLSNLYESLLEDEDIIMERIDLLSEEPFYEIKSNRLRNIIIVLVLSIAIGVIFTFFINFLLSLKKNK